MALPEITMPPEMPNFVAESQLIDPVRRFADLDRGAGHKRKRRVRRTAPRVINVASKELTQAQATLFEDWYEDILLAGERRFAVELTNQGPGTLWWSARWVEQPTVEPRDGRWIVSGKLHLSGEGSATLPDPSGLAVEYLLPLEGSAELVSDTRLAVEYGAELLSDAPMAVEYGVDLTSVARYYLLIGDGYRLLIGGGKRLRIS